MNISDARAYVISQTITPLLESDTASEKLKNQAKSSLQLLNQFKRIGDIDIYLSRFTDLESEVHLELEHLGLRSFESIREEFHDRFLPYLDQITTIDSFTIGEPYSGWDISICARNYQLLTGIYYCFRNDIPTAMLIKATLSDGKYGNEWIEENNLLKYYFYSKEGKFTKQNDDDFRLNKLLLEHPDIPVLLFEKENQGEYRYRGFYRYESHDIESDGAKYFVLRKRHDLNERYTPEAAEEIGPVLLDNSPTRSIEVVVKQFIRDPQVGRERLSIANGTCESCHQPAPFRRRSDNSPYLEVHHKRPMSEGGEDKVENTIALCPNCHRKLHHGVIE